MADKILKSLQFEADGDKYLIPEEVFVVNISLGQTGYVADKTFEEVFNAAVTEGKNCIARYGIAGGQCIYFTLVQCLENNVFFSTCMGLDGGFVTTLAYGNDGEIVVISSLLLPLCATSDAGKILTVDSEGKPAWTAITNAEEVAY